MARTDTPRVAIVGAGPVGLEAALYAASLKLPFTVYERGRVGEHLQQWGHVRLFSPFGMNVTPLGVARLRSETPQQTLPGDSAYLTGKEHLAAYLEPLARSSLLRDHIRSDMTVLHVGRRGYWKEDGDAKRGQQPFRLLLRAAKGAESVEEAEVVLDCTGTYGQHRWAGDSGLPALGEKAAEPHIGYGLEDVFGAKRAHYQDRTILVIGGGYSAATTVCNLAALAEKHPSTWVVWLSRGAGTQPIKRIVNDPLRERDQLAVRANTLATRSEGNVEFHAGVVLDALETAGADKGFKVRGRCAGKPLTWEAERVIANVGYTPDTELYRELHVDENYTSLGPVNVAAALAKNGGEWPTVPAHAAAALRTPEPNFYLLGAKSYGRNLNFLLRTGFAQVREAFALITGKADLDLYKKR